MPDFISMAGSTKSRRQKARWRRRQRRAYNITRLRSSVSATSTSELRRENLKSVLCTNQTVSYVSNKLAWFIALLTLTIYSQSSFAIGWIRAPHPDVKYYNLFCNFFLIYFLWFFSQLRIGWIERRTNRHDSQMTLTDTEGFFMQNENSA